jgi:hypothetical protein
MAERGSHKQLKQALQRGLWKEGVRGGEFFVMTKLLMALCDGRPDVTNVSKAGEGSKSQCRSQRRAAARFL